MNEFFWASSHLGWAFFSLLVFTALWFLLTDLVWRLQDMRIHRLVALMICVWVVGAGLIVTAFLVMGG